LPQLYWEINKTSAVLVSSKYLEVLWYFLKENSPLLTDLKNERTLLPPDPSQQAVHVAASIGVAV
jgi:hypothetical protein